MLLTPRERGPPAVNDGFAVTPLTLFADQSQSILDNLVALLRPAERGISQLGSAAVLSGISRHSSEGNDALDGWGSAIRPTADHGSVVRQFAI